MASKIISKVYFHTFLYKIPSCQNFLNRKQIWIQAKVKSTGWADESCSKKPEKTEVGIVHFRVTHEVAVVIISVLRLPSGRYSGGKFHPRSKSSGKDFALRSTLPSKEKKAKKESYKLVNLLIYKMF